MLINRAFQRLKKPRKERKTDSIGGDNNGILSEMW